MRKILVLVSVLFLFSINTAVAIAPTKLQIIENFVPVTIDYELIPRAHPKLLIPPVIVEYTKTVEGAKAYALDRLGTTQFRCLDNIFIRESHWRTFAKNSSSGAYGIPQALPGSKMATMGADWRTNPITQVKWGINYVNRRYGSACNAWVFHRAHGWY